MSDNSEPVTVVQGSPLSQLRILKIMTIVVVSGSIAGFAFASVRFGVGVLLGGLIAIVNYFWLRRSLKLLFDRVLQGGGAGFLAGRYLFRYIVLGLVIALIYFSGAVPIVSVMLGVGSFALAVVLEGLLLIFTNSFKRDF